MRTEKRGRGERRRKQEKITRRERKRKVEERIWYEEYVQLAPITQAHAHDVFYFIRDSGAGFGNRVRGANDF